MTVDEMVKLLNQSIPPIQKQLAERDRSTRLTVEEMTALLDVERAQNSGDTYLIRLDPPRKPT